MLGRVHLGLESSEGSTGLHIPGGFLTPRPGTAVLLTALSRGLGFSRVKCLAGDL